MLGMAEQALLRKDELSCKALDERSKKHGNLYHAIKPLVDEIGSFESVTIRALFDVIERDRLSCLELEKKAFPQKQAIAANAFRRQGNHYELLYQEIMYFVNKTVMNIIKNSSLKRKISSLTASAICAAIRCMQRMSAILSLARTMR
jgi:hypothetical protein